MNWNSPVERNRRDQFADENKHKWYGDRRIRAMHFSLSRGAGARHFSQRHYARRPRKREVELNGALSNPRLGVELSRLSAVGDRLLRKAAANPLKPRPIPSRPKPVLETITFVLRRENRPMRAREIYLAAEELLGQPLYWKSVKGTLFNYSQGHLRRFSRVSRGVYRLAAAAKRDP
jgi:hypothetical protein